MGKAQALAIARQRLADAKERAAKHARDQIAKAAMIAKAEKTLARLRKGQVIVYRERDGTAPVHTIGFGGFSVGWGTGTEDSEKKIVEALASGGLKVSMPGAGSISVAPSTAIKRTRLVTPADAKAILARQRGVDRAKAALRRAEAALAAACLAGFEGGEKPDPAVLWPIVAKAKVASRAIPFRYGNDRDYEAERLAASIEAAELHLSHTKAGTECPCQPCKDQRRQNVEATKERERIAALPKVSAICPEHGNGKRRRHPYEGIREERLTKDQADKIGVPYEMGVADRFGYSNPTFALPVFRCATGGELRVYRPELEKAIKVWRKAQAVLAKEAAKAERKRTVRVASPAGDPVAGDSITFTCPHCGTEATSEAYPAEDIDSGEPDKEALLVGCDSCESEMLVDGVRLISIAKGKEAKAA